MYSTVHPVYRLVDTVIIRMTLMDIPRLLGVGEMLHLDYGTPSLYSHQNAPCRVSMRTLDFGRLLREAGTINKTTV